MPERQARGVVLGLGSRERVITGGTVPVCGLPRDGADYPKLVVAGTGSALWLGCEVKNADQAVDAVPPPRENLADDLSKRSRVLSASSRSRQP